MRYIIVYYDYPPSSTVYLGKLEVAIPAENATLTRPTKSGFVQKHYQQQQTILMFVFSTQTFAHGIYWIGNERKKISEVGIWPHFLYISFIASLLKPPICCTRQYRKYCVLTGLFGTCQRPNTFSFCHLSIKTNLCIHLPASVYQTTPSYFIHFPQSFFALVVIWDPRSSQTQLPARHN